MAEEPTPERLAALQQENAELKAQLAAKDAPKAAAPTGDELGDVIGRALESLGRMGMQEFKDAAERVSKKVTGVAEGAVEGALTRLADVDKKK